MLEYFDEKLGKIKLVNVTEARANFAKLLADESHYYVITKNNKPQRVVISYEEFRDLRLLAEQGTTAGAHAQQPTTPHKASVEKNVAHKPYVKTPSRVKGLLTQHFQEPAESLPTPPPPPSHTPIARTWQDEILSGSSDDYFQMSDMLNPEEILVEPKEADEITEIGDDQATLAAIRDSLSISDEFSSIETTTAEDTLAAGMLEESVATDMATAVFEEAVVPTVSTAEINRSAKSQQRTPEEEEYYNKYRKLYESVPERAPEPSSEPQIIFENRKQREVKTIVDSLPDLNVGADEIARHFMGESKTKTEVATPQTPAQPSAPKTQQSAKVDLGIANSLMDEKSDLPSLQELLRGLDSEDVNANDLSEGEIDHIVKQIRHEE